MAHFPFVHTDILGSEPHTEVPGYKSEIRRNVDEVWATNCTFFQPQMTSTRPEGEFARLTYRVPDPFVVMLRITSYNVCYTKLLRHFVLVARLGSIRQAALAMNVAPSSVSRTIKQLEEDIA